jgi:hypothetical protein
MPNNRGAKGHKMNDLIAVEKIAQWQKLKGGGSLLRHFSPLLLRDTDFGYTSMLLLNRAKGIGVIVFSNGAANLSSIAERHSVQMNSGAYCK